MIQKVETKVIAATAGGGAGGVVGTFVLWVLGAWLWRAGWGADQVDAALAAVPGPVSALVPLILGAAGAFIGGYSAPHTERTEAELAAVYDARHD